MPAGDHSGLLGHQCVRPGALAVGQCQGTLLGWPGKDSHNSQAAVGALVCDLISCQLGGRWSCVVCTKDMGLVYSRAARWPRRWRGGHCRPWGWGRSGAVAGGQACWSPGELRETWRPVFKEGSVPLLHPGRLSAWGLRACSPCLFCPPGPPRRSASVSVSAAVLLPWLMWHLSPSASSGHCEPSLLQDHLQVPTAWAFWTGAPPRKEYKAKNKFLRREGGNWELLCKEQSSSL